MTLYHQIFLYFIAFSYKILDCFLLFYGQDFIKIIYLNALNNKVILNLNNFAKYRRKVGRMFRYSHHNFSDLLQFLMISTNSGILPLWLWNDHCGDHIVGILKTYLCESLPNYVPNFLRTLLRTSSQ
jgi:hypothetical protein